MVYFPARKCYHAAKIGILLILVVALLALFERWRGGKRSTGATFSDPIEVEYERQILEDEARIIPGLGEGGVAAHLVGEDKRLGEESEKKLAMNVYLSDRISYNRTLKDSRNPACSRVEYDAELPSASVILIFHNEPYSVVVRTIWSVVNSARRTNEWFSKANYVERDTGRTMTLGYPGQDPSSPFVYLKEIILVDDNSTLPELKGKLSHYVRTRLPPDLIRILRLPDRYATGEVLVFLDAHCEVQPDWLRPLLHEIKHNPHSALVPIIDVIDSSNFYYSVQDPVSFQVSYPRPLPVHVSLQGLMKARMRGARAARGDVLVFLDAHCEANTDWLRPLLQRVQHKRDAVLTPLIDVIDQSTFQLDAAEYFQVGGFTFTGHFTWIDVPEREKERRGSDIAPTWSPTMAGGLFAINRAYYWELGAYDEQMAGWGGENLEMSFRIWQCGGTLETIPCSRVGHVFRSFHPYGLPANSDTHGINTARMAEVWMDEYAELFYLHRPDLRNNPKIGDVTHRKILREKLHCKSFQWYLDNIYKEKFVPVRDVYGYGRFMNPGSGLCLDTLQREGELVALGAYPCHPTLQATQYFSLSLAGQLRDEENCAQLQFNRRENQPDEEVSRKVLMSSCHGKQREQKWEYDANAGSLVHVDSGLCLTVVGAGADVVARTCRRTPDQRWLIDYAEYNNFVRNDVEAGDREMKLKQLRGQRRISRSLLSYDSPEANALDSLRRKSHKSKKHKRHGKRRTKNKFIVKLVRSLANGSDEHLEVDIHCTHRQLYPNNSFVRDLVSILNDRNIKVINNGRVFEKNKVTEVGRGHAHKDKKVLNKMDIPQDTQHQMDVPKKHSKKHKQRVSPEPAVTEQTLSPPGGEAQGAQGAQGGQDHRIIIEDFVEVRPSTVPTKRPKKHKRIRVRTSTPPAQTSAEGEAPPASITNQRAPRIDELVKSPVQSEETKLVTPQDSIEDTPMLGTDNEQEQNKHTDKDNTDVYTLNEDWPVGESRFRSKVSGGRGSVQPLRRDSLQPCRHTHTDLAHNHLQEDLKSTGELRDETRGEVRDETRGEGKGDGREKETHKGRRGGSEGAEGAGVAGGKPVRLVMRTNLTFNLGHEFFKRAQQLAQRSDDGEELLVHSEPRAVPPIDLLVAPPQTPQPPQPRVQGAEPDSDSAQLSSSSSESSGDT